MFRRKSIHGGYEKDAAEKPVAAGGAGGRQGLRQTIHAQTIRDNIDDNGNGNGDGLRPRRTDICVIVSANSRAYTRVVSIFVSSFVSGQHQVILYSAPVRICQCTSVKYVCTRVSKYVCVCMCKYIGIYCIRVYVRV